MRLRVVLLLRLLLTHDRFVPVAAVLVLPLAFGQVACTREAPADAIPGVRLGMSPRDVRDRFEAGGEGSWQTRLGGATGATDDTIVEWTAKSEKSRVTQARFEFHLGMLVAIRAHVRDATPAQRIDVTDRTVTVRTPGPDGSGGTDVMTLARDCPTHREEAEALAAKGTAR